MTNKWKGTSNEGVLGTYTEDVVNEHLVVCESPDNSCVVATDNKISCGNYDETQCQGRGCCFDSMTNSCYLNSKSSPFYSLRRKWSHDSYYVTINGDTFYEKPKMPCEICSEDEGWKGYNINGHTICHIKPTDEGIIYQLAKAELILI